MAYSASPIFATAKALGGTGGTTTAGDTTGADIIIVAVGWYSGGGGPPVITDSKSNSWTSLTLYSNGTYAVQLYVAVNPTVGSGHTFTVSGSGTFYPSVCVGSWYGSNTTSPVDQQAGVTTSSGTTIAPGSITPSQNDELVITAFVEINGTWGALAIDGGFSIIASQNYSAGVAQGCALGALVQTTASAANPTWSNMNNATQHCCAIASFKAAGAASSIKTIDGLARASAKTVHGLALASMKTYNGLA